MLTTEIVTQRTLVIGLMALRAQAENGISHLEGQDEAYRQFGAKLMQWAEAHKVAQSFTESERPLFREPLGQWEHGEIFETFWRVEALKALLWSLGHISEMPSFFEVGNPNDVYAMLPIPKPPQDFIEKSKLRDEDAIQAQRHHAQFLNWRARTEIFRLQGMQAPMDDTYEAVVARALEGIEAEGIHVEHDGTDLLIHGMRFIDLDEETKRETASICHERQLALEWICSDDEDWDSAPCDT